MKCIIYICGMKGFKISLQGPIKLPLPQLGGSRGAACFRRHLACWGCSHQGSGFALGRSLSDPVGARHL